MMGRRLMLAGVLLGLTGCGAAYYGAALGILATQKTRSTTDISFPDAYPTDGAAPSVATLGFSTSTSGDIEVSQVDFRAGFGESRSNRDAGQTLSPGDRLVIRVDGDLSQELNFVAGDFGVSGVATVGSEVAAAIVGKVRALTPKDMAVSADAYAQFSGSYDRTTGAYLFRSGVPGQSSAVQFEATKRSGIAEAAPDDNSTATAARLGLGVSAGGDEVNGGQVVQVTVLNRGTDVIPSGTPIDLYLSKDKVVSDDDVNFDSIVIDETIAVGEARRFSRSEGLELPTPVARASLTPGRYFLLFDVNASGGEQFVSDNTLVLPHPVMVYAPVDDPDTMTTEVAAPLDFVIEDTTSQIGVVTGSSMATRITVSNLGAPVAADTTLQLELFLSADETLDEPAALRDPAGALAGVRINSTNPVRTVTVNLDDAGTGAIAASVAGSAVTISYDGTGGSGIATVQSLIDVLNNNSAGLLEALPDGTGAPGSDTLNDLLTAAGTKQVKTGDLYLTGRSVTFPAGSRAQQPRTYLLDDVVRAASFEAGVLPIKLYPLFRLRAPAPAMGADPENVQNDVHVGDNYVRVYDRGLATFDSATGATLPTVNADDFARLDAVTQRPVNTGTIRQGQQRVFSFELPSTGAAYEESQLLVILRASGFDAHIDLLSASGDFVTGSDDGALRFDPVVYTPVQSSNSSRVFYLVVSPARIDESDLAGGGEAFELTVSINPRQPTDPGPVFGVDADNVLSALPARLDVDNAAPRVRNDVLIPFSLSTAQAEVMLVLPQRARVRFRSRPVFAVGVDTVITAFTGGSVPTPVEHQAVLDEVQEGIVYEPSGGSIETYHVLERGVYTLAFEGLDNVPDTQPLRLEVETQFLPD